MRGRAVNPLRWYLLGVVAVCLATALTASIPILRDRLTFFAFWPTIFLLSWLGGLGPVLLTTLLSALAVVFVVPVSDGADDGRQLIAVLVFVCAGGAGALLASWRSRAEDALYASHAQLRDALQEAEAARALAEAANRAKDAFIATVSHELRTPLSPILAWSSMLRSGALNPAQTERALDVIHRSARSQAQLVEDLLDVTRIAEGKLRLHVRTLALTRVVENAVETVRPAADAKGIRLQIVLDQAPANVAGDPDRLQQIVWNLLSNAVKFTPKGGRVHVALARVNSQVELSVSDSGCGIPAAQLPRLFERFWQADSSTGRLHGGLGLGLAIARQLAELHGGTLSADSPGEGGGSRFTLTLPIAPVDRRAGDDARRHPAVADVAPPRRATQLHGLKVLVVDDDPDANEAVRILLDQCGAEVRVAGSTPQALDILDRWLPDVLVSDIGMPGEDGYALIARLRALGDRRGRLPAIALTAFASVDDRVRLLSAGYQMHVAKPAEPEELAAAIAAVAIGVQGR